MTFIDGVLLLLIASLFIKIISLQQRVQRAETRIAQMTKQLPEPPLESPIEGELLLLLKQGQDVQAVKRVREVMSFSLLDAKRYIDTLKEKL